MSVVVPNWNGHAWLAGLLEAQAAQSYRDFETVIVDNGSSDGSLGFLASRSDVRTVALGRNTGFTGAANAGIAAAQGELIVLLNNDMEPEAGFLAALVAAADAWPEAGSFACKVLFRDDPGRIDSAGDAIAPSGRSRGIGRGESADAERFRQARWVFGGTGGAVLYRGSVLRAVGGFDDDFFLYVEDSDVAMRAQLLGWRCRYVPDAVTRHIGGASLRGREDIRARYCLRNYLYFLLKDWPLRLVLRHPGEVAREALREALFAFGAGRVRHGGARSLLAVLATLGQVAWMTPKMLVKRVALRRRVALGEIEALIA